jgi:primosomal protein N''
MAIKPNTNISYPYLNQQVNPFGPILVPPDIDPFPWYLRESSIEQCFENANKEINQLEMDRQESLKGAADILKERLLTAYATYIECKSIWAIRDYPNWTTEKCYEKYNKDIEDSWKEYEESVNNIYSNHNRLLLNVEMKLNSCLKSATEDIPTDTR